MSEFFLNFLPIVIGLTFVALIALGIAAIQDGKHEAKRDTIVRRLYVYLVSFTTLLLVALSVATLLDLGLRATVFTKADATPGSYDEMPPSLYFLSPSAADSTKATEPVVTPSTVLSCASGCTLTEAQKTDIEQWRANYANWLERTKGQYRRLQAMVTPISFLLIAGIVFLIHWRFVRRDQKDMEEGNMTRATYFNGMSFVWLVVAIVAAGFVLTTALKSWIPGDTQSGPTRILETAISSDRKAVESLVTCVDACGLPAETKDEANAWLVAYDAWSERQNKGGSAREHHNTLAMTLAFLLVAAPLFWYHFQIGWGLKGKKVS